MTTAYITPASPSARDVCHPIPINRQRSSQVQRTSANLKMYVKFATLAALVAAASAQEACTLTAETHPSMTWSKCSAGGSCTSVSGSVTIDANWRWLHELNSATNCYTGNEWNTTYCDTDTTCAAQCCLDGSDYSGTYGVTTSGNSLNLKFVTQGPYSTNIGSRLYLMESDTEYQSKSASWRPIVVVDFELTGRKCSNSLVRSSPST